MKKLNLFCLFLFLSCSDGHHLDLNQTSAVLPINCVPYKENGLSGTKWNEFPIISKSNAFVIFTAAQLRDIAINGSLAATYEQCADIDLVSTAQFTIGGDVSSLALAFTGEYNGNDFFINNFTYSDPARTGAGLFSTLDGAYLHNMVLKNFTVTANSVVGGLIGFANVSRVENIVAQTNIIGDPAGFGTGGVIGGIDGESQIKNIEHSGFVKGGGFVAGVLGLSADSLFNPTTGKKIIDNISSSAEIEANAGGAGAIAAINDAVITNSHATGNVTIKGATEGGGAGFIGSIENTSIDRCYSTGNVDSDTFTTLSTLGDPPESGGFAVAILSSNTSLSSIKNSYSTGNVRSKGLAGGFLAEVFDAALIEDSYSLGETECVSIPGNSSCQSAGFVGLLENGFFGSSAGNIIVRKNFSSGEVLSDGGSVGGFIGRATASINTIQIENNFSSGNVTGIDNVGGFIGLVELNTSVVNSYASGNVTGNDGVGGFVGRTVDGSSSYLNSFTVSPNINAVTNAGTFVGVDLGSSFTSHYYFSGVSCVGCALNGTSEASMASFMAPNSAPLSLGWDFSTIWATTMGLPKLIKIP